MRADIKEANERKISKMFELAESVEAYCKYMNTIENYTVTINVTSADVSANPTDYVSSSVNSKKYVATFVTEAEATNAIKTKDMSAADTLIQYKYPANGSVVIINIR